MGIKRFLKPRTALGVFTLIVGVFIMARLTSLGVFTHVKYLEEPPVKIVAEVQGPEDLEINRDEGVLYFISSNPCSEDPARGGIYFIDLNQAPDLVRPFRFEEPQDFHPHGLSYFSQGDLRYLFTNNHRSDGSHSVEIFSVKGSDRLEHLETIFGPALTSPNDLVAISPRSFFVTNDGRAHDRLTRSVDAFLGRKTGKVLFFDGERFKSVVDNLTFPNGIAIDIRKKQLMVAETLSGYIISFQVLENNFLKYVDKVYAGVGIDNINLAESGNLIAAIHPNLWALSQHKKSTGKTSPSRIVQIDVDSGHIKTLYQQGGDRISGASAAVDFKESLYVGAVCDSKLLELEIPRNSQ